MGLEENCSRLAGWAGKVIPLPPDGIYMQSAAEASPASSLGRAQVSSWPGRLRNWGSHSGAGLLLSTPPWSGLDDVSLFLSKPPLGFLPEEREKDSIRPRSRLTDVGKVGHGQRGHF